MNFKCDFKLIIPFFLKMCFPVFLWNEKAKINDFGLNKIWYPEKNMKIFGPLIKYYPRSDEI